MSRRCGSWPKRATRGRRPSLVSGTKRVVAAFCGTTRLLWRCTVVRRTRAGQRPRAGQPRSHVRQRDRRAAGRRNPRDVVVLGGQAGRGASAERPRCHVRERSRWLGVMYANGRGGVLDDREAVRWFRRSAEQGYARGQASLGAMYRDGRGVSQDHGEAVRGSAAPPNRATALGQSNLGWMYENGRGVRRDRVEAARCYARAADQGDSWAQEQLDRLR